MCVLFLYAEITGYILSCLDALKTADPESKLVIYEGVNLPETQFDHPDNTAYEIRSAIGKDFATLWDEIATLNPDMVYVSGWMFPAYLKVARKLRRTGATTIIANDTPWHGTIRQRIGCIWSRLFLVPVFDWMWVPGERQREFARRLGFKRKTQTGSLTADTEAFCGNLKTKNKRHKLLSVGSFVPNKGMKRIAEAFLSLAEEKYAEWSLHLIGQTTHGEQVPLSPRVQVSQFIQPSELPAHFADASAFVLASKKESWGIVVHEAALAGLPLLLSKSVGAAEAFLREDENGWLFDPEDAASLKAGLSRLMDLTDNQRAEMGKVSVQLSRQQSTQKWAERFLKMRLRKRATWS